MNHICGTLLINLRFSKHCTQQIKSCPFNPPYGHNPALHVDPNCYCPVLCSHLQSCQPCMVMPIRPPEVQGPSGTLSRSTPVSIPVSVSVPTLNHLMRVPGPSWIEPLFLGIPRSASANSLHSMNDSPRHRSSKSKTQFYQQDIRPTRRPPMYDKRMYPIMPTKSNCDCLFQQRNINPLDYTLFILRKTEICQLIAILSTSNNTKVVTNLLLLQILLCEVLANNFRYY